MARSCSMKMELLTSYALVKDSEAAALQRAAVQRLLYGRIRIMSRHVLSAMVSFLQRFLHGFFAADGGRICGKGFDDYSSAVETTQLGKGGQLRRQAETGMASPCFWRPHVLPSPCFACPHVFRNWYGVPMFLVSPCFEFSLSRRFWPAEGVFRRVRTGTTFLLEFFQK